MQIHFNKIMRKKYLHLILIIIISTIAGQYLGEKINFSTSTLYWTASTIAQAFGALIALTWAVAMYHSGIMKERFMNLQVRANAEMNKLADMDRRDTPEFKVWFDVFRESQDDKKKSKDYLYYHMGNVTTVTLTLIIISIAVLGFTHHFEMLYQEDFLYANRSVASLFILLLLLSSYCLFLILRRMVQALVDYQASF